MAITAIVLAAVGTGEGGAWPGRTLPPRTTERPDGTEARGTVIAANAPAGAGPARRLALVPGPGTSP